VSTKMNTEVSIGFDYGSMKPSLAEHLRSAAKRIRERIKRTLEDIIAIGQDLLQMKGSLAHGQFGPWMLAEFGWTDRTARNFMAVAEQFGPKTEMISDLSISPTAAYLLAAPSAPFEARQTALDRAKLGENVTAAVAKEILGATRKSKPTKGQSLPWEKRWNRVAHVLDRLRTGCTAKELAEFARELRHLANILEKGMRPRTCTVTIAGKDRGRARPK